MKRFMIVALLFIAGSAVASSRGDTDGAQFTNIKEKLAMRNLLFVVPGLFNVIAHPEKSLHWETAQPGQYVITLIDKEQEYVKGTKETTTTRKYKVKRGSIGKIVEKVGFSSQYSDARKHEDAVRDRYSKGDIPGILVHFPGSKCEEQYIDGCTYFFKYSNATKRFIDLQVVTEEEVYDCTGYNKAELKELFKKDENGEGDSEE